MTANAAPYRQGESSLFARERALEAELRDTREKLAAYANEEVRLTRRVLEGGAKESELVAARGALTFLDQSEERLVRELEAVRAEIVARGERKVVGATTARGDDSDFALGLRFIVGFALFAVSVALVIECIRGDTATRAPEGATYEWGGPVARGNTWLYVEDRYGFTTTVDGLPAGSSARVEVSATESHDVVFTGGKRVHVRWIPCTTALVIRDRSGPGPRVERSFNHAACF